MNVELPLVKAERPAAFWKGIVVGAFVMLCPLSQLGLVTR